MLCLIISYFIVRKFNNPVENMVNIIKQSSGNNTNDEIINLRYKIEKAADMLKNTGLMVKDISLQIGIINISTGGR